MKVLGVSNNQLHGIINQSICNITDIIILDLSNNTLIGRIPQCLGNISASLKVLNLKSNVLIGTMPAEFLKCDSLFYLDLSGNQLEGDIPKSLSSCKKLKALDVGNNMFTGLFPYWLQNIQELQVLNLRFNKFHGSIKSSTNNTKNPFPKLQILDISNNNFSGELSPSYFKNIVAMINSNKYSQESPEYMGDPGYQISMDLTFNGLQLNFVKVIVTMSMLDLSNNSFKGKIPETIGGLHALRGLNLSHNIFTGKIPKSFGNLSSLLFLDLSTNKLSGQIPQELASLAFLEIFNVSENQLEGVIPHGQQFNTFSADLFQGNPKLCGKPLLECGENNGPSAKPNDNEDGSIDDVNTFLEWKIIMLGFGSGVLVGLAWGYYIFFVVKPFWSVKFVHKMELVLLDIRGKHIRRRRAGRGN